MASLLLRNVVGFFSRELKVRAAQSGRTAEEEHRRILESALTEPTGPERQRYAVAKRLNKLVQMLNGGDRGRSGIDIPRMAELLGLNTAGGLEAYFHAEDEAPFDLLDRISKTFGLNPEWLKFGRGETFNLRQRSLRSLHLPGEQGPENPSLDYIVKTLNPQNIFFVRSLGDIGQATVILQTSAWRYEGFYDDWHVSNRVGASGERQLFELWELLKTIEKNFDIRRRTFGRDLPEDVYHSLRRGEVFPGAVLDQPHYQSFWQEDFTDAYQTMPIARDCDDADASGNGKGYAHYGKGFQSAQATVRSLLDMEKEKGQSTPR
ncbi:FitA-like ribbon-helix-helix domain-containing protein [Muricoccus vinaceus]|uniref:Antitoxin FitA-like ribbon-helix-helix domain-containing protein n=1 Tax=Muricoccus vinaceus TaxID=424704 RepID=A0ABV6IVF6_9PROT